MASPGHCVLLQSMGQDIMSYQRPKKCATLFLFNILITNCWPQPQAKGSIFGRKLGPSWVSPQLALSVKIYMFASKTCSTHVFVAQRPFSISSLNFDTHLYDIYYEYFKPHWCKCNSFGCIGAMKWGCVMCMLLSLIRTACIWAATPSNHIH